MQYDLSRVPTEDLKALRNKNYGAVSTPTLQYLKTGDPKNMQGTATGNATGGPDTLPRSVPQAWSMAWGAKNPSGRGRPGYKTPPPEEWGRQNEITRRVSAGIKKNIKDTLQDFLHPVQTAEETLIGLGAPFSALARSGEAALDPYSPWSPRISKGPGHAPEVPQGYREKQEEARQKLDAAWKAEKDFVKTNAQDPRGIPRRALDYAIDNPVDAALMLGGGVKLAMKIGKMGKAAGQAARVFRKGSPASSVERKAVEAKKNAEVARDPGEVTAERRPQTQAPRLRSGAEVERDILRGVPLSGEEMNRFPELLKKHERDFVRTAEGGVDFAILPARTLPAGLPQGPIRLQRGNERFGEFHIEGRRAKLIRNEGFSSSRDFVEDAVRGATQVWQQPNGRLLLVKRNGKDYITVVELQKQPGHDFYNVVTAMPTHDFKYAKRKSITGLPSYEGPPLASFWGGK